MDIKDINIPEELIAQHPMHKRDDCKLLTLEKATGRIGHKKFKDIISLFKPGDVIVLNDSKVVNARFHARKTTGGVVELFLLRPATKGFILWTSLIKGKNIRVGTILVLDDAGINIEVVDKMEDGTYQVRFPKGIDVRSVMEKYGRLPLPPYVKREPDTEDEKYYQTVFAKVPGSVASPTAALHFTPELLSEIKTKGVDIIYVTLEVGYGTFSVVRDIDNHVMHEESYSVDQDVGVLLRKCRKDGNRIWAVGTTVVRTLESAFNDQLELVEPSGATKLFIRPGYHFKVVDSLITNFHHPSTTLIYLVAAFAGENNISMSYEEAVQKGYRMLSYGDAMVIF